MNTFRPKSEPPDPTMALFPVEEAFCLRCQALIPRQNILRRIMRTPAISPTRQRVQAYCEHCSSMYEIERTLREGLWQPDGEVRIVTDPGRKMAFLHRISEQLGIREAS